MLSKQIKTKTEEITKKLIETFRDLPTIILRGLTGLEAGISKDVAYFRRALVEGELEERNVLVASCIALEYEARECNAGILLRGTSFEHFQKGRIAGSTVLLKEDQTTTPYSISFGNSLFLAVHYEITMHVFTAICLISTMVMLFSSIKRITLNIKMHSSSLLRLYRHWFLFF